MRDRWRDDKRDDLVMAESATGRGLTPKIHM